MKGEGGRRGAWERRERERAVKINGGHGAMAGMGSFVSRKGRESWGILSADGAGSQPDSVWGRLSNRRIHHSDCRPCYWWRHESEHGEGIRQERGPSEQPWHSGTINGVLLCCTVYFFCLCALIQYCIYAHYASCHPAIRFITQDYNGTSHSFLFCLTREHN